MSKIHKVRSMKDIDPCVNECSPDHRILTVRDVRGDYLPNDLRPNIIGPESLQTIRSQSGTWFSTIADYNDFVSKDYLNAYDSICRLDTDGSGPRQGLLILSQNPLMPAGDFPACDAQRSAMRRQLPLSCSPEVAEYLKSKLEDDAGCTDGEKVKLLPDASALDFAVGSIEEDLNSGTLPDGVDEWMAEDLIGNLQTIAWQDPVVVQERSMQKQMWEQREIGIMGAAGLFFARIFPGSCDN